MSKGSARLVSLIRNLIDVYLFNKSYYNDNVCQNTDWVQEFETRPGYFFYVANSYFHTIFAPHNLRSHTI